MNTEQTLTLKPATDKSLALPKPTLTLDRLLEKNLLPDWLIRIGIRRLLRERLARGKSGQRRGATGALAETRRGIETKSDRHRDEAANEQHYEVPTRFYQLCLGARLEIQRRALAGRRDHFGRGRGGHAQADVRNARSLADGQNILELGCGWGSLSLWMAEQLSQRAHHRRFQFGDAEARTLMPRRRSAGLKNLRIITCDMNRFDIAEKFDRVVSVEMFEHMKNYERLMANISRWLKPDGKLFVHIFTHKEYAYHFVRAMSPTGWRGIFSPAASCRATICCFIFNGFEH
jgi:cyclopropane-fatty-acyl-phospholipid synthase